MHPAVRQAVSSEVTRAFREVESQGGVVVGAELRSFMEGVIAESLDIRQGEWIKNRDLDPDNADSSRKIASEVGEVVHRLAAESETYSLVEGRKRVSLIGFLQLAHKNWCGIFPFCR